MSDRRRNNLWYQRLDSAIGELGGMLNAHMHLDRAGTLDETYMSHVGHRILDSSYVSLHRKHSLITHLHHGLAYQPEDFDRRVNAFIDDMVEVNTVRADSLVDITNDGLAFGALERMLTIQRMRASEIDLRIGAYTPFGFDDAHPGMWSIFAEGARQTDFIAALPEADDVREYPTHIGFDEHCRRTLMLAQELNKPLHVHVDQRNEPTEDGTERLIRAIRQVGAPLSEEGETMVWAVHLISPSTYDDRRFEALVQGMLDCNVGLITCPSAAIGMRMYRPIQTPTYNSIPRVLEMLEAGVHVRIGSDNVSDICSPSTTANLVDEVFVLSAALRFYQPEILARLASGQRLDESQVEFVREHLRRDDEEIAAFMESR